MTEKHYGFSRKVLLNPGPITVSEDVRKALTFPDVCHREPEYFDLQDQVRALLLSAFGLSPEQYTSALITGSGTAALEMSVCSAVSPGRELLVLNNGVYGDRIAKIARCYGIKVREITVGWCERHDLSIVEEELKNNPGIEVVAMVHHETTTGLLNDIEGMGQLAQKYDKALLLDTVSGLAGETFDFDKVKPAFAVCTANKSIQGLPGISFAFIRQTEIEGLKKIPPRSLYFNLPNILEKQDQRGTPFTPAVQIMNAFRTALIELCEETVQGRVERLKRASSILRAGFEKLGLKYYVDPKLHYNTITSLVLPEGLTYDRLHDQMKEAGYVIYAGQGDLRKEMFRISNMGLISDSELDGVIETLDKIINR